MGVDKRPMGPMSFRFLDRVMGRVYLGRTYDYSTPRFPLCGHCSPPPSRNLGPLRQSIYHIQDCPAMSPPMTTPHAKTGTGRALGQGGPHPDAAAGRGVHFTPGPSAVPVAKLGLRACMAALSGCCRAGSEPAN